MKKRIAFSITPTPDQKDFLELEARSGFRSVNSVVLEMIQERMMLKKQSTSFQTDVKNEKAPNA
jgi:hypothetical protein